VAAAGRWQLEKKGLKVEPKEGAWRVRYWIDNGPLWGTRAAAMLSFECWSGPLGAFTTAEAAMRAAEDGGDPDK
jgi:hypothetical protein